MPLHLPLPAGSRVIAQLRGAALRLLTCTARAQLKQMRKEVADLLRANKQENARIRVETVIRENLMLQVRRTRQPGLAVGCVTAPGCLCARPTPRHAGNGVPLQAYEVLELFVELLAVRVHLIEKCKERPQDMNEALGTLVYAAARIQVLQPALVPVGPCCVDRSQAGLLMLSIWRLLLFGSSCTLYTTGLDMMFSAKQLLCLCARRPLSQRGQARPSG